PARVRHAHLAGRPREPAEPRRPRGAGGDDRRGRGGVSEERMKARVALIGLLVIAVLASLLSYGLHQRPRIAGTAAPADSGRAGVNTVRLYFGAVSGDSLVSEPREMVEATTVHDRNPRG